MIILFTSDTCASMKRIVVILILLSWILQTSHALSDECPGPKMELISDNKHHTCTDILASKYSISYTCSSLIKGHEKALIKYCPVEMCQVNNTWSKPSISCAMSECYHRGRSREYMGHRSCTVSGRPCQRWDMQMPVRHRFRKSEMFPDFTISLADNFCRDPDGTRGSPWCFTTDPNKKWEFCAVLECSIVNVSLGYCGMEPLPTFSSATTKKTLPVVKTCSNDIDFDMKINTRMSGNSIEETKVRSALECATYCGRKRKCRAFTFSRNDGVCKLHGGSSEQVVSTNGEKSGVKMCKG